MGALREQQGGTGVTEVVKADVRAAFAERPPEQRLEGSVAKVGGVDEGAVLRGEDEAAGLVEGAHLFHLPSCLSRCPRRASVATAVSRTLRRLLGVLRSPKTALPPSRTRACLKRSRPRSRSTSSHLRPRSSPSLMPV